MSNVQIDCTVIYQTQMKRKLQKFLDQYGREIDKPLHDVKIEKYSKIDGLFQATFKLEVEDVEPAYQVYRVLQYSKLLEEGVVGYRRVNGPYEHQRLVFECVCDYEEDD